MEPIRLDLENFLSYRRESVDLTPVTCGALIGENGAGKSSLLDAVTWALYGQGTKGGARELDNYVTRGETEGRVELEFRLNGSTYKVVRGRSIARNKSTLEFFILEGDNWRPLSGKSLAETQAVIEQTLRMDYRTFTASSLVLQGQSDAFTANMTDQERKEALARILGLDIWDRLQERAREKVRGLKNELAVLENQGRTLREQAEAADGLRQQLEDAKASLESHLKAISELEPVVTDLRVRLEQRSVLTERQESIRKDLVRKDQEVAQAQSEAENAAKQIELCQREIASKESLLAQRDEIEAAAEMEKEMAEEVAGFDNQAQEYMRLQQLAADLERKASAWDKQVETEIARLESQLQTLSRQAATLDKVPCSGDIKASCPLLASAKQAAAEIEGLRTQFDNAQKLKNPHIDAWQKACKDRNAVGYDSQAHQAAKRALEDVRKTSMLKSDLDAASRRVDDLKARINEVEQSIRTRNEQVQSLKADIADLQAQYDAIQAELRALVPLASELHQKQQELDTWRQREAETRTLLGRLEQQMAEAENARCELDKLENNMSRIREDGTVYEILDQACGKRAGVPALIVENAVPEIERLANDMLGRIAGGRLTLRLDTQVEGKSTGTMQEVLRITVLDGGLERPYQTYSGAERFMVDLALRVSLSKFLAHRAGAEIKLFVLDEGLGACDSANRQAIMNAIQTVAQEFGKTLVITHIAELQDALPQRIEVTKGPDGSRVRVA